MNVTVRVLVAFTRATIVPDADGVASIAESGSGEFSAQPDNASSAKAQENTWRK
jgi:hypothetical protein